MQIGDQRERDDESDRVDCFRVAIDAEVGQGRFEQACKGRLADPTQAQRGERNAQLASRQVGIHLPVNPAKDAAPQALAAAQLVHAGMSQLDDGELGGHEKTVQRDQEKREQQQQRVFESHE